MKIKKYIMQSLLPVFAAGWLISSILSCTDEDVPDYSAPKLEVQAASNVLRTSVTFSGTMSGETNRLKDFGFEYSISQNFPTDQTTKVSMKDSGATTTLTTQVRGLSPSTFYYYRMYATTGATTVYSQEQPFNTTSMSSPQLSTLVADSIGEKYARFRFYVEDYGNEVLTECGVSYKKNDGKTFIPVASEKINPDKQYVIAITDLEPNTEYEFRAYAKNAADIDATTGSIEGYGASIKQKTAALLSADVTTLEIASGNIGINSAKVVGRVLSAKGSNGDITECGFVWSSTVKSPTLELSDDATSINPDYEILPFTFTYDVTGLNQSTTYYICAYAKNIVDGKERVAYGEVREFSTIGLSTPTLNFTYDKNENGYNQYNYERTANSIQVKAYITNYDGPACWEKGIIWSKTDAGVTIDKEPKNKIPIISNDNQVNGTITGLEMASSYYIRAYAIYKAGEHQTIGYTEAMSCNTESFNTPSLEAVPINFDKISRNSIELTGKISSPGNGTITERGFVMSLTSKTNEPTLENNNHIFKSNESFVTVATGLTPATNYAVRAYVKCELGNKKETVYSSWTNTFSTSAVKWPTFNKVTCAEEDKTFTSLKVTSGIASLGDGALVEKGFCWLKRSGGTSKELTIENCTGSKKIENGTQTEYSYNIPELEAGTSYDVRAYAKVTLDKETTIRYSYVETLSTNYYNLPSISTGVSEETFQTAKLEGFINGGNVTIAERGFVICLSSKTDEPTLDNCDIVSKSDESFVTTVKSLTPATNYTVRAYVKCKLGDKEEPIYAPWSSRFRTKEVQLPTFNNVECAEEDKTFTSLKVTSGIASLGDATLIEKGFCWLKRGDGMYQEVTLEKCTGSKKVEDGTQTGYSYNIPELESGTSYYIRAYVKATVNNTTSTVYSSQNEFITKSYNLPSISVSISEKSFHTAKLMGAIDGGNITIKERGFVVTDKDITPTIGISGVTQKKAGADFTITLDGLKSSSNYRVRSYAICLKGTKEETIYSSTEYFNTQNVTGPTIENLQTSSDLTSITASATITAQGDGKVTEVGFCYIASGNGNNPTIKDAHVSQAFDFSAKQDFSLVLKNLVPNTTYIVNAYAKIKIDEEELVHYYGNSWTSTTSFGVTTINYTPEVTTCKVNAQYTDGSCTEYGFVWAEKPSDSSDIDPAKATGKLKCTNMDTEYKFSGNIEGLSGGKTYYLWAYAVYSGKTIYNGKWEFSTKRIPGQGDNVSPDKKE